MKLKRRTKPTDVFGRGTLRTFFAIGRKKKIIRGKGKSKSRRKRHQRKNFKLKGKGGWLEDWALASNKCYKKMTGCHNMFD